MLWIPILRDYNYEMHLKSLYNHSNHSVDRRLYTNSLLSFSLLNSTWQNIFIYCNFFSFNLNLLLLKQMMILRQTLNLHWKFDHLFHPRGTIRTLPGLRSEIWYASLNYWDTWRLDENFAARAKALKLIKVFRDIAVARRHILDYA